MTDESIVNFYMQHIFYRDHTGNSTYIIDGTDWIVCEYNDTILLANGPRLKFVAGAFIIRFW